MIRSAGFLPAQRLQAGNARLGRKRGFRSAGFLPAQR